MMFVLRVMRNKERVFKDELTKVVIKGKDIKINSDSIFFLV